MTGSRSIIHKLPEGMGPPEHTCPCVSTRARAGACGRALGRAAPRPKATQENAKRAGRTANASNRKIVQPVKSAIFVTSLDMIFASYLFTIRPLLDQRRR
jgi:hypothetical protein